jgi:hypothetical protein
MASDTCLQVVDDAALERHRPHNHAAEDDDAYSHERLESAGVEVNMRESVIRVCVCMFACVIVFLFLFVCVHHQRKRTPKQPHKNDKAAAMRTFCSTMFSLTSTPMANGSTAQSAGKQRGGGAMSIANDRKKERNATRETHNATQQITSRTRSTKRQTRAVTYRGGTA